MLYKVKLRLLHLLLPPRLATPKFQTSLLVTVVYAHASWWELGVKPTTKKGLWAQFSFIGMRSI